MFAIFYIFLLLHIFVSHLCASLEISPRNPAADSSRLKKFNDKTRNSYIFQKNANCCVSKMFLLFYELAYVAHLDLEKTPERRLP